MASLSIVWILGTTLNFLNIYLIKNVKHKHNEHTYSSFSHRVRSDFLKNLQMSM